MSELSEFEPGHIVGARMVGASVPKIMELGIAKVFGVSRSTVPKIENVYRKNGKYYPLNHNVDESVCWMIVTDGIDEECVE